MADLVTIATGRFLSLVSRDGWEFATRSNATGVVAILAVTPQKEVVLVEQHRPPIGGPVIEIPAGLVGDRPDERGESAEAAARRELLEETGFLAPELIPAGSFASSAGLTDETVEFFVARDAERMNHGGGVDGEQITVHLVPASQMHDWLTEKTRSGIRVDARVLAGLSLLKAHP